MGIPYFSRFWEQWKVKKQLKEEERIKDSRAYCQLAGRLEERESILRRFTEGLIKAEVDLEVSKRTSSSALAERDARILGLEERLGESEKLAVEYMAVWILECAFLENDKFRIGDENRKLVSDNQKLLAALALSKKYLAKFKCLYEETANNFKREISVKESIDNGIAERECLFEAEASRMRKDYLGGLESLSASIRPLIQEIAADVKRCSEMESNKFAVIFKLFEKELSLDKIEGVYIDSSFNPAYATPGFYKLFNLSLASDLLKTQGLPEIIEYAKNKRKEPYNFKALIENTERNIEARLRYALGKSGIVMGVFVEYDHKTKFFERLPFMGTSKDRSRAGENIERLFNEGNFGGEIV